MTTAMPCNHQHKKLVNALWCVDCGAYNELDGNNWQLPSGRVEEDISIYGQYIEKDGKRIDPKDFYKPPSGNSEKELCQKIYLMTIDELMKTMGSTSLVRQKEFYKSKSFDEIYNCVRKEQSDGRT